MNDNIYNGKRKYYLDALRILSIFFVIYNHTYKQGYLKFSFETPNTFRFYFSLFISIFCKFSVPMFFMISGIIFLKKDIKIKNIFSLVLKYFLILLIVSLCYFYFFHYENRDFLTNFIHSFLTSDIEAFLWFLYAYISYLICIPILKTIISSMNKKLFYYFFILIIIFMVFFPTFNYFISTQNISINTPYIWILNTTFVYPLLGYCLDKFVDIENITPIRIVFLNILNFTLVLINCLIVYNYNFLITNDYTNETFIGLFSVVNCFCLFVTYKYIFNIIDFKTKIVNFFVYISKMSFGVYLLHICVMHLDVTENFYNLITKIFGSSILIPLIYTTFIYIVSLMLTFALSKIPIIKKIVNF